MGMYVLVHGAWRTARNSNLIDNMRKIVLLMLYSDFG